MTSVQKRKERNWSPSSHSVESQQGLPTESHCSHLRAPFRHFERLMTHPHGNYVNVLYLKALMLQRRKSLTEFGHRPFTKQTYPSTWKVIFIKMRQIEVSFLKIPKFRMECYPL